MKIQVIKTRIFKERDDLISFIINYIPKVNDGDILVITSKIVALSENRTVEILNNKTREEIIKRESQFMMKTKYTWLTIKDGMVLASAGVDESNANGKIILLPKDSFYSAVYIRRKLKQHYKIKNLGIIISDSRLLPLRVGVVGIAIGYAGFKGVKSYINREDIFGRILKFSRTDVADSLATSAVLLMGEGNECQPLAVITDAPAVFTNGVNKMELYVNPKEDIYQPLFERIKKIKY